MLGKQIKHYRKQKNWSQEHLASVAGLKQVIISRIERGIRNVTADELQKLAHALGVSVTDLLEDDRARAASE
ncbi:helix-turn-helix domain-containing protein [Desulfurispora thermophila]|uniref:helix-turn-helix domain-containing protein n=1 Tax=Desulfurispora thermophila TaxID=265470 RepID=UPI00037868AC|nr:helix-turn-helix transcriptional regulator [Desulfurispora thermophila]